MHIEQNNAAVARQTEPDKLSELQLKVSIKPAELFEDNRGGVTAIAVTDRYVLVNRSVNEKSELAIYDENGRISRPKAPIGGATALTGKNLADALASSGKRYVRFAGGADAEDMYVADLVKRLGYPPSSEKMLVDAITKHFTGNSYQSVEQLRSAKDVPVPTKAELFVDESRRQIAFVRPDAVHLYNVADRQGRILPPDEWVPLKIEAALRPDSSGKIHPLVADFKINGGVSHFPDLGLRAQISDGNLIVTNSDTNTRVLCEPACAFGVDPIDGKTLWFVAPDSTEIRSLEVDKAFFTASPIRSYPLAVDGAVKEVRLDPHGNFIFLRSEKGDTSSLTVVAKDGARQALVIPEAFAPFDMDHSGQLYFLDKAARLRVAETNLLSLPIGGAAALKEERLEALSRLAAASIVLDPLILNQDTVDRHNREGALLEGATQRLRREFGPLIADSQSIQALDQIGQKLDKIRPGVDFPALDQIFDDLGKEIEERRTALEIGTLLRDMDGFREWLSKAEGAEASLALDANYTALASKRAELAIADLNARRAIDEELQDLDRLRLQKREELRPALEARVEESFAAVEKIVAASSNSLELSAVESDAAFSDFERFRAGLSDPESRSAWRAKHRRLIGSQAEDLEKRASGHTREQIVEAAKLMEECAELLAQVAKAAESFSDPAELARWRSRDPQLGMLKAKHAQLPPDLREHEEGGLNRILDKRRQIVERRQEMPIRSEDGIVQFGKVPFPIATAAPIVWQPKLRTGDGSRATLYYRDNLGREFEPRNAEVPMSLSDPATLQRIGETWEEARKHFLAPPKGVPSFDSRWVINDFSMGILEAIAKNAARQLKSTGGLLISEGEAGTGKNLYYDMFSHFTGRGMTTFACNRSTEKEDLTYLFKFDPKKGTYQVDSKFIEMIQTPGGVVVLDEINTLPTGMLKMLNPLFDYRRKLFLADGREIAADPSVIFLATMNPRTYLGTLPLSAEVVSRATIMRVGYPPEKENGKYSSCEAEIMARHTELFRSTPQKEFKTLWNYCVNGETDNGGDRFVTPERDKLARDMLHIVKCANKLREAYRAFHSGQSSTPFEFIWSLRESIALAADLDPARPVKELVKEAILPKIGDAAEAGRVETILANV